MEPIIKLSRNQSVRVRDLLYDIGTREKHWPANEVVSVLDIPSEFIGVFDSFGNAIGGAQVSYTRPFGCEKEPFCQVVAEDTSAICEFPLIGVDRQYRRSTGMEGSAAVIDALIKGLYHCHAGHGGRFIYALCEMPTFMILTDLYVRTFGETLGEGKHFWCGTDVCPGPKCQPTFVCRFDMVRSEERWKSERPDFWTYLTQW